MQEWRFLPHHSPHNNHYFSCECQDNHLERPVYASRNSDSRQGQRYYGRNVYDKRFKPKPWLHKNSSRTFDSNGFMKHQKRLAKRRYKWEKPKQQTPINVIDGSEEGAKSSHCFGAQVKNNWKLIK